MHAGARESASKHSLHVRWLAQRRIALNSHTPPDVMLEEEAGLPPMPTPPSIIDHHQGVPVFRLNDGVKTPITG
jgi:hypothetical protein